MPNATLFLSREGCEGYKVKAVNVNYYPAEKDRSRFAAVMFEEKIERPGFYFTLGHFAVHADTAADVDVLIAGLTKMRELLASAEAVEANNRRAAEAVPLADALKDPAGFVAGMTETRANHRKVWLILSTGAGGFNGRYWSLSANGGNGGWSERPEEFARFDSEADARRVAHFEQFRPGMYKVHEAVYSEAVRPSPESEPHAEDAHSDHAPVG